jgi:hypothetical protein
VLDLRGVDIDGVKRELDQFIEGAALRARGEMSTVLVPKVGRQRALELSERVIPILDRLYPAWRDENPPLRRAEFSAERDACLRLRARIASSEEIEALFAEHDAAPRLSAGQMHVLVWRAASAQWSTGHRHEAVLAAAKAANSRLQEKLGRRDLSDVKLVQEAFSEKPPEPGRPRLRFGEIADEQTRESLRQGVMSFGVGCFRAIRNPVGHLPNDQHELGSQAALERLAALSLFVGWIDQASIERKDSAAE